MLKFWEQFFSHIFIVTILVEVAFANKVEFKDADKANDGIAKDYISTTVDCNSFRENLPDGCTASFDCSKITCKSKFIEKDLTLTFTINKCELPVTVTAEVEIDDLDIDFIHTFASSEKIGIPGFSYSIGVASAGVYLGIDLTPGDDDILQMKVYLTVSVEVLGKEISKDLTVMEDDLPISTDECGIVRWWKGLSVVLKLVVVGGGIIFLVLLLVTCCCCCRRRRSPGNVIVAGQPNPNIMVTTNSKVPMQQLVNQA